MTKRLALLFALLLLGISTPASAQEYDIRKVRWGMNHADVRRAEGKAPLEERRDGMVYLTDFMGTQTLVTYFFAEDKVIAAAYIFKIHKDGANISAADAKEYMQGYAKLESLLRKKYGEPIPGNSQVWSNDEHRNNPDEMRLALAKGHVQFLADWETANTEIKLALKGGDGGAALATLYKSKLHDDLLKEQSKLKEAIALDDL